MPGGTGGGKPRPPKMRLHRASHDGAIVYADYSLKSPFLLRVWAAVLFIVGPAVIVYCNRKGEVRQVWLAPKTGRRGYVDGGGAAQNLGQLAEELSQCLRAPVRREARSLFQL